MKLKVRFILRFFFFILILGILFGMLNNLTISILFNIFKPKGNGFLVVRVLIATFYSGLAIYLTTRLNINVLYDRELSSEDNINRAGKFLFSFFIVLIGVTILLQVIFYNANVSKISKELNTYSGFVSKGTIDNHLSESKRFILLISIIEMILSSMFMILMIPISRKMLSKESGE